MTAEEWTFCADDARDARASRREFMRYLRSASNPNSDFDAAEMIFGELVGNVIRHAPGPIRISLTWSAGYALLRIIDFGAGFFESRELPELMRESGRGLFIVRRLARDLQIAGGACKGSDIRAGLPVTAALRDRR